MVESIIIEGGGDLNNSVLINNNRWNDKLSTSNNKIQTNSLERIIWEGAKCVVQSNVNFDNDSKKKIFQCYNRAVNAYRTCVIVDLIKYEILHSLYLNNSFLSYLYQILIQNWNKYL